MIHKGDPREKTFALLWYQMLVFYGIVAGSLQCWTHPLPGNLFSGNIQKVLLHYMTIAYILMSCTRNLFACCQSAPQGYEAQDPGHRSSPGSRLLTGMFCLRTAPGSACGGQKHNYHLKGENKKWCWETAGQTWFLGMNKSSFDWFC